MGQCRGKTKDGKWVYGWYSESWSASSGYESVGSHIRWLDEDGRFHEDEVIPETVGQSTGLKDKNGEGDEIYAGDLIKRPETWPVYAVVWRKIHGQWWLREWTQQHQSGPWVVPLMPLAGKERLEVIGRIHDAEESK